MKKRYNSITKYAGTTTIFSVSKYLILILSFVLLLATVASTANAKPVVGFKAGNIIDDLVFTNKDTMNVTQIQAFLNSKVPVCDNMGTMGTTPTSRRDYVLSHGYTLPMTCLKDYQENGLSSAQIIYNASQTYSINPQVLIVLLQKEQGLVTDDWPIDIQYRSATGYGCPDTAACDSTYYGFTNQVNWAAHMFRAIFNNSPTWYTPYILGNNFVKFNPNASCGGTNINIENKATQALYDYTPYQPNQAALDAGYGTGDSCSSHGNRDFYQYFIDWFGSVRYIFGNIPSSQSVYARSTCNIRYFANDAVGRLYNPDTRDYFFTRDYNEACGMIPKGYIWDDVVMLNADGADAIPIYRLTSSTRHIFTPDSTARDLAISEGYVSEGVGFYAYSVSAQDRTPVYGLSQADTIFTTSSGKEAEYYINSYGYTDKGIVFYTPTMGTNQQQAVMRMERNNQRIYTPHQYEKDNASRYGFKDEGVIGNVDIFPNPYNMPVYRTRSQDGIFSYTTNRIERDLAIINYQHTAEGIPFYALMWSDNPIYGAWNPYNGFRIYTGSSTEFDNATINYSYKPVGISWYSY